MADTMTTSKNSKRKPMPTWYYLAGAGAVGAAYFLYSRRKASSAAATAAAPSAAQTTTPDAGTQAELASIENQLANLQGAASTAVPSSLASDGASIPSYTVPSGQSIQGSDYGTANGVASGNLVSDSAGQTYQQAAFGQWTNGAPSGIFGQLVKSGQPLYYQPAPGIFTQWMQGKSGLAPGTPVFTKVV